MSWLDSISREALFIILLAVILSPIVVRIIFAIGNRNRDKEKQILVELDKKIADLTVHINEVKVLLESQKNKSEVIYVDNRIQEDINFVPTNENDISKLISKPNFKDSVDVEKAVESEIVQKHESKVVTALANKVDTNLENNTAVKLKNKALVKPEKKTDTPKSENKKTGIENNKKGAMGSQSAPVQLNNVVSQNSIMVTSEMDKFKNIASNQPVTMINNPEPNKPIPNQATTNANNSESDKITPIQQINIENSRENENPFPDNQINVANNNNENSIVQPIDNNDEYLRKVLHTIK